MKIIITKNINPQFIMIYRYFWNVNYHGIEFSETIFELVKKKFPELKDNLFLGDFINFDYKDTYDIVVDRSSLTHNTTNQIKTFLENISKHLHRNALFIGIDWFADDHFFKKNGYKVDENTFTFSDNENIFNGLGTIHFSSYIHIKDLFNEFNFSLLKFHKKSIDDILDEKKYTTYNFIAKYNGQNY